MATTKNRKINAAMRDAIVRGMMAEWKKSNPEPELKKAMNSFADAVWHDKYGSIVSGFKNIPDHFLTRTMTLRVLPSDSQYGYKEVYLSEQRIVPTDRPVVLFSQDMPEYKAMIDTETAHELWKEEKKKTDRAIKYALIGITTVKKLIEVWPEAEPYIPAPPISNLPAVDITYVNNLVGLPAVEADHA